MALPPFPPDALEESDATLGQLLLAWFIATQAYDCGVPLNAIPEEFAEQVRQHVLTLESATAKDAALEKALHKAADGDFETAGKLLRELLQHGALHIAALDELKTGSRRQRSIARKSRPDALQSLILGIMKSKPGMKPRELLEVLREYEGGPVIDEITEDKIFFIQNGQGGKSAPISGLKDRMSRARKKLSSR